VAAVFTTKVRLLGMVLLSGNCIRNADGFVFRRRECRAPGYGKLLYEILSGDCMGRRQEQPGLRAPAADSPALDEVVRRLIDAYDPERIYLFGSVARGEAGPDSDYDLMVIVPDDAPPERRRSRLAYQVLRGTGTAADVLVWPKSSFERRVHVVASLPATVLREGKLVYGA
jgi:predicted nucleotidyltransferase